MEFNPTDVERLILANQYDILSKLDPDQADHHGRMAHNLRHGHAALYRENQTDLRPRLPEQDANLARNALSIFGSLQTSTEGTEDPTGTTASAVAWPGFDGNNESELLGYTAALHDAGDFVFLMPNGAINSHCEMRDVYARMLDAWEEIGKPHEMSTEQVALVIAARRHPSML